MPQAIYQYNGLHTSSTTTVYTCPADTISIVVPSITVGSSGNGNATIGWNSSTVVAQNTGNLAWSGLDYGMTYLVAALDKYNIRVAVNSSNQSYVYFSPNHTTNINQAYYALNMPQGTSGPTQNPFVTGEYTPNTNTTSGTDSYYAGRYFHTGPWTMSASDKLTIRAQSAFVQYNFLIIEEAV